MNKFLLSLLIGFVALQAAPRRFRITVSIAPQKQFVEKVAGTGQDISILIPQNTAPVTYSPTPRQMMDLENTDLYYSIGMDQYLFETQFIYPYLADHPNIRRLKMSEALRLLPSEDEDEDDRGEFDPHIWLAPENVIVSISQLCDMFVSMDPENASFYRENTDQFIAEIHLLQMEIHQQLDALPSKNFMVYHPAWSYFAHEFGLHQISIEQAGKSPGPRQLMDIINQGRKQGIKVIFVQEGFSQQSAKVIARELNAEVLPLNPLDPDWTQNLKNCASAFQKAVE